MCFILDENRGNQPEIATTDIVVYKVMWRGTWWSRLKGIKSPFTDYVYKRREIQPKVELVPKPYNGIPQLSKRLMIDKGYHSYDSFKVASNRNYPMHAVFQFLIPKGSLYYYNSENREYVSNQIKVAYFTPLKH